MSGLTGPTIRVGATQLNSIAAVGELTLEWRFPFGCWNAAWQLGLKPLQQPPALYRDAPVTATLGGIPVWVGDLDEPDYADEAGFSAMGAARSAEKALCFASGLTTTSIPNVAINQAISRGALTFAKAGSISDTAYGEDDETGKLNTVAALLDAWSDENNTNWVVTPERQIRALKDPTTPMWHVLPGTAEIGLATETLASRIVGLWASSNGRLNRTSVGTGRPEVAVDLTEHGTLTATRATNILNGILKKTGPAAGSWSNTIEVTANQIISPGGTRPHLATVGASICRGAMVRLLGHPDPRSDDRTYAGRDYTDVICEAAEYNAGENTLTFTPRGYADRDLSSIIESAGGSLAS